MSDEAPEKPIDMIRRLRGQNPTGEQTQGSSTEESSASKPVAEPQLADPTTTAVQEEGTSMTSGGDQRVPIERLQQALAKHDVDKKTLKEQDTELATLREQLADHTRQQELADIVGGKRPSDWDDLEEEAKMVWLARETAQRSSKAPATQQPDSAIASMVAKLELMENDGFSLHQAGIIHEIQSQARGLTLEETVMLAMQRSPDLFAEEGSSESVSSVPATHTVNSPSSTKSTQAPDEDPLEAKRVALHEGGSYKDRQRKAIDFIGTMRKQSPLTRQLHGNI